MSENTNATHMSEDSFVVLDENGNPQVIEIETELDIEDIETFNDINEPENILDNDIENDENNNINNEDDIQDEKQKEDEKQDDVQVEESQQPDDIQQDNISFSPYSNYQSLISFMAIKPTASASSSIVRFKTVAELDGKTVTYTEMDTGREGYFNTNMSNDAAYISTDSSGNVICKLGGVVMKVPASCVKSIQSYSTGNISYYYVNNGYLLHYFSYINGSSVNMSSNRVGYKPSYLESGKKYYSYDGHYFYSSFASMITDYKNYASDSHANAVNKNDPYYNYYQYLSLRSKTTLTASQLNARISSKTSKMYNKAQTFIDTQNTYGINASLMFGIAINESASGTSSISQTKNNLFGLNAVDSSPSQSANYFTSVDQCIKEFAYNWMSQGYLDGNDSRYRGPHLGDKRSGINVKYASDPYWGEKGASQNYFIEGASNDCGKYKIGISQETILTLYKESSTANRIYSSAVNSSGTKAYLYDYPIVILGETTVSSTKWYKVQSDMPLKADRSARSITSTYDFTRDYVYTKASQIKVVNAGTSGSTTTSPNNPTPPTTPTTSTVSNSTIISKLSLTNSNGYLTGFKVGTDVKNLISNIKNINSSVTITVKNSQGTSITSGVVTTGMTLTLKNGSTTNTYTFVIRGDVNGDGAIKSSDYVRIKNYIMGSVTLSSAAKLAADANKDGNIKSSDYVRIKNYIMGSATIEQ